MIPDKELKEFIEANFEERKGLDVELVRDILTVSRLYDRNLERLRNSKRLNLHTKSVAHISLEKLFNRMGEVMRDIAGIRSKGPVSEKKKSKKV